MTEPTVQVPVSLIEHIRRTYSVLNLGPNVVDALDALLSQPTPTAESALCEFGTCSGGDTPQHHTVECATGQAPAEPPRVEDMAPGTTFTAQMFGGGQRSQFQRISAIPGSMWQVFERGTGRYWHTRVIDPSTIRDVTPPK